VPLVAHNHQTLPYTSLPRYNKDLLQPLTGNWLRALKAARCRATYQRWLSPASEHRNETLEIQSGQAKYSVGWWRIFGRRGGAPDQDTRFRLRTLPPFGVLAPMVMETQWVALPSSVTPASVIPAADG
jgi:hypothetical protein